VTEFKIIYFLVVDINAKPIVGAKACEMLNLIQRIPVNRVKQGHSDESSATKSAVDKNIPKDVQKKYGDLFKGLGSLPGEHTIRIDPHVQPIAHPPRKVPPALKEKVKRELDRMERDGVVVKQQELTPSVNSMVTVTKANGKVRICIDPRDLKKAILRKHFPLKTIEDVVTEMEGPTVFTKLDAT
jgi:hypothetical protein